jgi:dTMP kinase
VTSELSFSPASPRPPHPGTFVVLEGGDGSGKSTQARLLAARLEEAGHDVVLTREPGGTEVGERLRELVLRQGQGEIDPHTEALIYAAARAAHAHQLIGPALGRGAVVVCDRYIDSSAAYQGAGRGLGEEPVTALSRWATGDLLPDLTVVLDVPLADARERMGSRGDGADRLEAEPDAFHSRVNASFARLAEHAERGRAVVDGTGAVEAVAARVWGAVEPLLGAPGRVTGPRDADDRTAGSDGEGRR